MKAETDALASLHNDKCIVILSAIKGIATVVKLSKDYKDKMNLVLSHPVYGKLNMDPTSKIERKIACLIKKSHLPGGVAKKLITSCHRATLNIWSAHNS